MAEPLLKFPAPEANYYRQADPIRRRCLKQTLDPFSIGHAHLLATIESPFAPTAWDPESQTFTKLMEAVFVCAHPYAAAKAALRSPWVYWRFIVWGWRCGRVDGLLEREILRRHILEATALPETAAGGGRDLGAPALLLLWQHLRFERGMSETEAMDCPYGKAAWDFLGFWEKRKGLEICNATEREMIRMTREAIAEAKIHHEGTKPDQVGNFMRGIPTEDYAI